jgi:ATP-dependent DNA helicase RecQ
MDSAERAQELLQVAFGEDAKFRPDQLRAIIALVDDGSRVLVVQRTGWGKSVVYFLATALLREKQRGPTILISPLLALMRDQVRMATRLGVRAETLNSENPDRWEEIEQALQADEIDVLLVSPERLANERFRGETLAKIPQGIGLFVVDEAHCISDWGHDFRPDYRRLRSLVAGLPQTVPLLATTATANNRVIGDVTDQLGDGLSVIRGELGRDSLHLQVVQLPGQAERLAWLADYLPTVKGSGIIYVLTHADAERVSDWLASQQINAPAYVGGRGSAGDERQALEEQLINNEVKALVATVALGMGFDKPDLAFVVHYQRPGSSIAYYQQIGRAGRALERAEVVLLAGEEDEAISDYFIEGAFPPEQELQDVLSAFETVEGASEHELGKVVNLQTSSIQRAVKFLEVDGALARAGSRYTRTPTAWAPDTQRALDVTEQRHREHERMVEFVQSDGCLMAFIRAELDDPVSEPCGHCANCVGAFAASEPDAATVQDALQYLRRLHRPIKPRKQWFGGIEGRRGKIPVEYQALEGRALAVYGDAGLGKLVKAGKYGEGGFDDQLVEAIVDMLENDWEPEVTPTWITAVPSLRAPELVPDFAKRLAMRLGLPYRVTLEKTAARPPQKTMENNHHQARNALASFRAIHDAVTSEPVFLIDDMVDSGWSLTTCAVLLGEAGSGPVVPLALAETSTGPRT